MGIIGKNDNLVNVGTGDSNMNSTLRNHQVLTHTNDQFSDEAMSEDLQEQLHIVIGGEILSPGDKVED